jgi:ABC-2 type transport system permease protein
MILGTLFLLVVLMYVIFLSSFFKTTIGWTEVMAFSTYPLFLVSGYSWPVEAMPKFLQFLTGLLPATPYYKMFNMLSVQGSSFNDIIPDLIHLILLVLFGYLLLFFRFKFLKHKDSVKN